MIEEPGGHRQESCLDRHLNGLGLTKLRDDVLHELMVLGGLADNQVPAHRRDLARTIGIPVLFAVAHGGLDEIRNLLDDVFAGLVRGEAGFIRIGIEQAARRGIRSARARAIAILIGLARATTEVNTGRGSHKVRHADQKVANVVHLRIDILVEICDGRDRHHTIVDDVAELNHAATGRFEDTFHHATDGHFLQLNRDLCLADIRGVDFNGAPVHFNIRTRDGPKPFNRLFKRHTHERHVTDAGFQTTTNFDVFFGFRTDRRRVAFTTLGEVFPVAGVANAIVPGDLRVADRARQLRGFFFPQSGHIAGPLEAEESLDHVDIVGSPGIVGIELNNLLHNPQGLWPLTVVTKLPRSAGQLADLLLASHLVLPNAIEVSALNFIILTLYAKLLPGVTLGFNPRDLVFDLRHAIAELAGGEQTLFVLEDVLGDFGGLGGLIERVGRVRLGH